MDPKEQNNIIDLKRDGAEKFRRMALGAVLEREKKKKDVKKVILNKKTIEELKALVVSQLEDDGISAVLWFDKLTTNGLTQIPFILSLSKGVSACLNPIKFRLTNH